MAWLMGIAGNLYRQWSQKGTIAGLVMTRLQVQTSMLLEEDLECIERRADLIEYREALRQALQDLKPILRDAVILRVAMDLSYEEVAARVGCTVGAAGPGISWAGRAIREVAEPPIASPLQRCLGDALVDASNGISVVSAVDATAGPRLGAPQRRRGSLLVPLGRVAELADALASGASVRKDVGVQVPPRPPGRSHVAIRASLPGAGVRVARTPSAIAGAGTHRALGKRRVRS